MFEYGHTFLHFSQPIPRLQTHFPRLQDAPRQDYTKFKLQDKSSPNAVARGYHKLGLYSMHPF